MENRIDPARPVEPTVEAMGRVSALNAAPASSIAPLEAEERPDAASAEPARQGLRFLAGEAEARASIAFDGTRDRQGAVSEPLPAEDAPAAPPSNLEPARQGGAPKDGPPAVLSESERPAEPSRFWSAVKLGATLAILAPVLYHAAPAPMLFYAAPAAFALVGLAWVVASAARLAYRLARSSERKALASSWVAGWKAMSRPLPRFWLGALAGLGVSFGMLLAHGVLPLPSLTFFGVASFAVWAGTRLLGRTGGLAYDSASWLVGEASWDLEKVASERRWTRPLAWAIHSLRWGAMVVYWLGVGLSAPARRVADWVRSWATRRPAVVGLAAAFSTVIAAPLLAPMFSIPTVLYFGVLAVGGLWLIGFAAEASRLVKAAWRWAFDAWRNRGRGALGVWRPALAYLAAALLGLGIGQLPYRYAGPVVEKGFYLGTLAARRVQESRLATRDLPKDWQEGLRMIAEGGEVREIQGGAFEEETIREIGKIPRGRALLEEFRDSGGTIRLPKFYLTNQTRTAAFENPIVHGVFIAPGYVTDRWSFEDFQADEAKQRQLARDIWQLSFHELTHTRQSFRLSFIGVVPQFFPGQFDHFPWQVTSVFHLELEYEAHIEETLAGLERLEADPHAPVDEGKLVSLLTDLEGFLSGIDGAGAYEAFKHVDSKFFRDYMAGVKARLPADGVRAFELLALRYRDADPRQAWLYLDMARARAREHGLPEPTLKLPPRPPGLRPAWP